MSDTTSTPTSSPATPGAVPDSATEALQATLAAEHAAVFVYAALGGQASRSAQPGLYGRITAAYRLHRTRRDELIGLVRAAGAEPVAAEPGYQLPADLGTPAALTARALRLEQDAASTYAYLVASSTGATRTWAVTALLDAAVRGLGFGGRPETFPGL
ncbi:hypothetical protein CFH99_10130 [Nocardioides aromaticivorans]|uniref:DUF4439 domain-containing protein n=1 Tax=Nocardioides aromaticivorans TaxID=200618 RepID=A0ABX7PJI7_9ACTN|nr:ferritin-like domain-containing protein [Nocardioides aromaticivorans]QSR25981.1 hypothetical protein CFH99_10130 [Nocardioides aromaticivorans]